VETMLAEIDKECLDIWSVPLASLVGYAKVLDEKLKLAEAALSETISFEQRLNAYLLRDDSDVRKSMTDMQTDCVSLQQRREAVVNELTSMHARVGQVIEHIEKQQGDEIELSCSMLFPVELLKKGQDILDQIDAGTEVGARRGSTLRGELISVLKQLADHVDSARQIFESEAVKFLEDRGFQGHVVPLGQLGFAERFTEGYRLFNILQEKAGLHHGTGPGLYESPPEKAVQFDIPMTKVKKVIKSPGPRKSFVRAFKETLAPLDPRVSKK
jgi:hypothetical protein